MYINTEKGDLMSPRLSCSGREVS